MTLVIGGIDTSSHVAGMILYNLAKHPDVLVFLNFIEKIKRINW